MSKPRRLDAQFDHSDGSYRVDARECDLASLRHAIWKLKLRLQEICQKFTDITKGEN